MAEDKEPLALQSGANLTKQLEEIRAIMKGITANKAERQQINADIQALREKATTIGIPKAALDMAMRYLEWEPEKREGFDLAYMLVREAGGLPMQGDLFASAEQRQREKVKAFKEEQRKTEADAVFAEKAPSPSNYKEKAVQAQEKAEQEEGDKLLKNAGKGGAKGGGKVTPLHPVVDDKR